MDNSARRWLGQRVLVTGGAGFIGSHLVGQLVEAGARVAVIDNFQSGRKENLSRVQRDISFLEADILTVDWSRFLSDAPCDAIFHFAANAYVPPSVENPTADCELNFGGTYRLIDALRRMRWPGTLVYASSAAVYGNAARMPIREDDPTVPVSPYGVGKLAAERYVAVFAQLYGLRAASVRFFSSYGPRQRKQVVYDLMERIAANPAELFIHGDGTQIRDFVYVEDAARAAAIVAERGALQGEVYNVGSGEGQSIGALAGQLCRLMDARPRFAYSGSVRPGDPEKLSVDIGRLSALGYRPQVTFAEGLRRCTAWYRQSTARGGIGQLPEDELADFDRG